MVAQQCAELSWLNCTRCLQLGDDGTIMLALKCPRLTSLYLARCCGVTDTSLTVFGDGFLSSLRELHLAGCRCISDVGLRAVASGCPQLVALHVDACAGVSDESFTHLAASCPQLTTLQANGCSGVRLTHALTRSRTHSRTHARTCTHSLTHARTNAPTRTHSRNASPPRPHEPPIHALGGALPFDACRWVMRVWRPLPSTARGSAASTSAVASGYASPYPSSRPGGLTIALAEALNPSSLWHCGTPFAWVHPASSHPRKHALHVCDMHVQVSEHGLATCASLLPYCKVYASTTADLL